MNSCYQTYVQPVSWHDVRRKAALNLQRIVLADGEDPRIVKAAILLQAGKIVSPWLVGSADKIGPLWKTNGGSLSNLPCLDPAKMSIAERDPFIRTLLSLPKFRNLSPRDAGEKIKDPLVFGCLYLKLGHVDGFVGGATRTTADTLRAVLSIIGLSPKTSTLFGFFLLETCLQASTPQRMVLMADCAVVPDPSPKQLANIALGAADAFRFMMKEDPKVAFLSFSTLGSAQGALVDKVRKGLQMARSKDPTLCCDGEWQADTALDPYTAQIKGAGLSAMAGKANVLIVPDLNCGNIAYKLVQRLGGCRAVGPILWGTAQPANDLSRGCSTEDVVDAVALTALQAQASVKNLVGEPSHE